MRSASWPRLHGDETVGPQAFGVFDPKREGSPKKAWEKLAAPQRVTTLNAPRFRKNDELGAILRAIVKSMLVQMDSRTKPYIIVKCPLRG